MDVSISIGQQCEVHYENNSANGRWKTCYYNKVATINAILEEGVHNK
jgi:hypothetical protein